MSSVSNDHVNKVMSEHIAESVEIANTTQVGSLLAVNNTTFYTEAESFSGNPDGLLGSVMQLRTETVNGEEKQFLEFCPTKIPETKVDPNSQLKEPIKRQSIIVDRKLTLNVNFLNYLSTEIGTESTYSLLVFDQATGQVDRNSNTWSSGINEWKSANQDILDDPSIDHLFIIIGYVQKYVIRKKYTKFDVKAKGGGFGVNVDGTLYTSSEDYSLDIRYGLTISSLKRTGNQKTLGLSPSLLEKKVSASELEILKAFTKILKPS